MTTDSAVLETVLIVIAVCMAIQTVMFIGVAIGGLIAYRRATVALTAAKVAAEAQVAELRERLQHVSATVDDAAQALIRGTSAVDDVMTDVKDAMGTVRNSVGTVASVVAGPRTALALGLLKGLQTWRRRRDAQRIEATATSEL
jgi:ABC-type transporter Mla subunit MlaD